MTKIPILETYEYEGEYLAWCPFCETWHHHGMADGSRASHCWARSVRYKNKWLESPFHETGYILKCKGVLTPAIRAQYRKLERRRRCISAQHREECIKNVKEWHDDEGDHSHH